MKTKLFFLPLLMIGCALAAYGQGAARTAAEKDDKPKTELELFQEKYGSVIVQGFNRQKVMSGTGGTLEIIVKEYKNATSNTKVKGLVVELDSGERYSSPVRSFIEYGEIDSLIKGIGYISKIDKSVTTLSHFEAKYSTKGDFALTLFNRDDGSLMVAVSVGRFGSKNMFITPSQLAELASDFQQAKVTLDTL